MDPGFLLLTQLQKELLREHLETLYLDMNFGFDKVPLLVAQNMINMEVLARTPLEEINEMREVAVNLLAEIVES